MHNKSFIYALILIAAFSVYQSNLIQECLGNSDLLGFVSKEKKVMVDFLNALTEIDSIRDKKTFNIVISRLNKIAKSKYYPAYVALGSIYKNKYQNGSEYYGVKGQPQDLLLAIEYLTVAAEHGLNAAQNALAELYLDEANIFDHNRSLQSKDVEVEQTPIKIPNLVEAVYWLEKAAKNGNPAAQGTLSDLYKQGIGIPQDYVMAYAWANISLTSQLLYNDMMHDKIGKELTQVHMKGRDELYNRLTVEQKNHAKRIVDKFKLAYIIKPSADDEACTRSNIIIFGHSAIKLLDKIRVLFDE